MEEKIRQSIRTFLTYDLTSRKDYLNPHCKETSKRLDNDANKLTELVLKEIKKHQHQVPEPNDKQKRVRGGDLRTRNTH